MMRESLRHGDGLEAAAATVPSFGDKNGEGIKVDTLADATFTLSLKDGGGTPVLFRDGEGRGGLFAAGGGVLSKFFDMLSNIDLIFLLPPATALLIYSLLKSADKVFLACSGVVEIEFFVLDAAVIARFPAARWRPCECSSCTDVGVDTERVADGVRCEVENDRGLVIKVDSDVTGKDLAELDFIVSLVLF